MKFLKIFSAILIFASTFSSCTFDDETIDPSVEAYNKADYTNGGIMYDKFWASESDFDQSNANIATLSAKGDFFRCKQCHGWDGLGNKGAYINRAPKTSRPNISGINLYEMGQSKTAQELFDGLKKTAGRRSISTDLSTYNPTTGNVAEGDKMPNLTELLTDAQIWDMVKFMKEGMMDVSQLYDATYTGVYPTGSMAISNVGKDGNATNGKNYYNSNCAACHGANGTTLNGVPHVIEGYTIGQFTRKKGNEVQHKVHYGQLGSPMTGEFDITTAQMKDLYKALANETDFPNAN
jgi:mono/diheme cytochrome c family protein